MKSTDSWFTAREIRNISRQIRNVVSVIQYLVGSHPEIHSAATQPVGNSTVVSFVGN